MFYVILGLLKFCTFGFMLIWTLVDILLIALQVCTFTACRFLLFFYSASIILFCMLITDDQLLMPVVGQQKGHL